MSLFLLLRCRIEGGMQDCKGQREAGSWWFFCGGVWELLIFSCGKKDVRRLKSGKRCKQNMVILKFSLSFFFCSFFVHSLRDCLNFLSLSASQFAVWLLLHVKIKPINTCYRLVNFSMVIETIKILTRSCQSQEQRSWRVSLGRSSVDLVSLEYVIRGFEGNLLMLCMHLCVHTIDTKIVRSRDMQCNNCEESPLET